VNVLLVRADGIGDALACTPLIAALRDAGHVVGAVLGPNNRAIFAQRTLSAVHVLERIAWPRHGSTAASRRPALAQARAAGYDVALVASEELDAFAFAKDAGIERRVGYVNGFEKPFKTLRVRALLTKALVRPASAAGAREHEVETLFRLGAGLSGEPGPTRDPARLRPLLLDEPVAAHGAIVLQVSCKLAREGLDLPAYAALAMELRARGHRVLVVGDDAQAADAVARQSGAETRTALSLEDWKGCIAGARALVTPDSGAAHVAGMLGVPCVDCFPPGRATAQDVVRWRPWAAPARTVVLDPARERSVLGAQIARAVLELIA
jgi:ADP-heptose:LPS heptosyltransferase